MKMLVTSTPGSEHKRNENKRAIASCRQRKVCCTSTGAPLCFLCTSFLFPVCPSCPLCFSLSFSFCLLLPFTLSPLCPFLLFVFLSFFYLCLLGKERGTQPGSLSWPPGQSRSNILLLCWARRPPSSPPSAPLHFYLLPPGPGKEKDWNFNLTVFGHLSPWLPIGNFS